MIDTTGKITGYKTKAGADTVFPFSSANKITIVVRNYGKWSFDGREIWSQNITFVFIKQDNGSWKTSKSQSGTNSLGGLNSGNAAVQQGLTVWSYCELVSIKVE